MTTKNKIDLTILFTYMAQNFVSLYTMSVSFWHQFVCCEFWIHRQVIKLSVEFLGFDHQPLVVG